jgi:hypothetical protein
MSLQAAIEAELPYLRAEAEARMVSRVRVLRKSGRQTQNEATGEESPEWLEVHVNLPFRLDFGSSSDGGSRTVTIDGISYESATAVGHFPALTTDLLDGDLIDIVTGECAGDVYSIVKAVRADQKTARRLPIVEESRPDEWGI